MSAVRGTQIVVVSEGEPFPEDQLSPRPNEHECWRHKALLEKVRQITSRNSEVVE